MIEKSLYIIVSEAIFSQNEAEVNQTLIFDPTLSIYWLTPWIWIDSLMASEK